MIAWLIPPIGLIVSGLGLYIGRQALKKIGETAKLRKMIQYSAIGLMLTLANGCLGVILAVLGII